MLTGKSGFFYFQTLLLRRDALLKLTTGHIIDLVSNDVQRLEQEAIKWGFYWVMSCFEIVVVTFLLVYLIGWQSLLGILFLCFLVPYFAGLSFAGATLRLRIAVVSDKRLSLMNQVVRGIRAIKTHAWEDQYQERIKHLRRYE